MSHFYYNQGHQPGLAVHPSLSANPSHNSHGARSRRGARYNPHNASKSFKVPRPARDPSQIAQIVAFRKDFEAARSFDLEDDEIFCPFHLLTEDDLQSIHSSSSDRSSSSAGDSPESSPLQPQVQPTPTFALSASANPHIPANLAFHQGNVGNLQIHQPLAQRTRNAIPIVDPNSRNVSPPHSISPGRQQPLKPYLNRRWQ